MEANEKAKSPGYIASALVPYDLKFEIDETEYVAYLKEIAQADGLCGVYVNAWVGEIYSLKPEERQRLIKIARATLPRSIPVISGIIGFNLHDMVKAGLEAKEAGAGHPGGISALRQHAVLSQADEF